jgi:hypothetical protein
MCAQTAGTFFGQNLGRNYKVSHNTWDYKNTLGVHLTTT